MRPPDCPGPVIEILAGCIQVPLTLRIEPFEPAYQISCPIQRGVALVLMVDELAHLPFELRQGCRVDSVM
eukprot:5450965-Pyramimonas_sp.AAC.1